MFSAIAAKSAAIRSRFDVVSKRPSLSSNTRIGHAILLVKRTLGTNMHLGKFHAVIAQLNDEYNKGNVSAQIQSVIQQLDAMSSNPGNADIASGFKTQLEGLRTVLSLSSLNKPYPTLAALLDAINARSYVGDQLFQDIEDVIAKNGMTPQLAASSLRELLTKVAAFYQEVATIDAAFGRLEIEYTDLEPGEGEIGISIPKPDGKRLLSKLASTAKQWDKALRPFVELADPERDAIEVKTISSSDWQFYLSCAPVVLLAVSGALIQLNTLLKQVVETKKLVQELRGTGISAAVTAPVEEAADNMLSAGTRQLAEQIVEKYKPTDAGRANELKNELAFSLTFMAKQLAQNVTIEVRYLPPEAPKAGATRDAERETVERVAQLTDIAAEIERNMDMFKLDAEAQAILNLPAPEDEAD